MKSWSVLAFVPSTSRVAAPFAPCALLSLLSLLATPSWAVPTTMTYAGVLTDDGARVDGTADVTFRLFDDDTAGTEQYREDFVGLVILDGELVAELGNAALDDTLLDLPELWLEVTVDGTALAPRVRMNSVPYALRAEAALRAEDALTLGGLRPIDLVTAQQLANLGLQNGVVAGTGIAVSAGVVSLATAGITSAHLAPEAVTTSALADNAVSLAKLQANSVDAARIIDAAITLAKLASNSVDGSKIIDGSVTLAELSGSSVDSARIVDGSVALVDLAGSSVDTAKIVNGTILAADFAADAVTAAAIGLGQVGSSEIGDGSIAVADIGGDAVTAAAIGAGQVGTTEIADNAVSVAKIGSAVPLFRVTSGSCVEPANTITPLAICSASTVGCPGGQCKACGANVCIACSSPVCPNVLFGFLVGP